MKVGVDSCDLDMCYSLLRAKAKEMMDYKTGIIAIGKIKNKKAKDIFMLSHLHKLSGEHVAAEEARKDLDDDDRGGGGPTGVSLFRK